jgi:cyclopropane-fatty-acyl-phospholipid synthase
VASKKDIERTYDYMDDVLRRSLGEFPDLSCAYYNGDYSLTLEEAQRAKHDYVLHSICFKPGMRVLDIGCGWGPILQAVQARGGYALGITLSSAQVSSCQANSLNVHLRDWRELTPQEYGRFDAIVSLGAFEHFCSIQEYLQGEQDNIYRKFFELCHSLLPKRARLYLQTMVWDKPPDYETISLKSPRNADAYIVALLEKFYPGSWLPHGERQITQSALGFRLLSSNSGRPDYIQTIKEWRNRQIWRAALSPHSLSKLAIRYATDHNFRYQLKSLRYGCNRLCFEREIMDHRRIVFEKS